MRPPRWETLAQHSARRKPQKEPIPDESIHPRFCRFQPLIKDEGCRLGSGPAYVGHKADSERGNPSTAESHISYYLSLQEIWGLLLEIPSIKWKCTKQQQIEHNADEARDLIHTVLQHHSWIKAKTIQEGCFNICVSEPQNNLPRRSHTCSRPPWPSISFSRPYDIWALHSLFFIFSILFPPGTAGLWLGLEDMVLRIQPLLLQLLLSLP